MLTIRRASQPLTSLRYLPGLLCLLTIAASAKSVVAWQPDGTQMTGSPNNDIASAAVTDGREGVIVVWTSHVNSSPGRTELRAQRLSPTGAALWASDALGVPICTARGNRDFPKAVSDGAGGMYLGWFDSRIWVQAYAHRITGSGTPAPGWPTDGLRLAPSGGTQFDVDIASDNNDGMYITWRDERTFNDSLRAEIYVQRLTGSGLPADGWAEGGIRITRAIGEQSQPTIVSDGDGGALLCWRDSRSEWADTVAYWDIYAQHVLRDGQIGVGWPENGRAICEAPGTQDLPVIVSDGSGGAIIVWRDFRAGTANDNSDVFAERVTGTGELLWGNGSGIPIAAEPGYQWYPIAVSDGAHGAFITWQEGRPGRQSPFYLSHVDELGQTWLPGGRHVEGAENGAASPPILAADGQGGVYIAWAGIDYPESDYSIFLQRYAASGDLSAGWSPVPHKASAQGGYKFVDPRAPGTHGGPITADGSGGVFLAWSERRNGRDFDTYAQRIGPGGQVAPTPPTPEVAVQPNPARLTATVSVSVPADGHGVIRLYDVQGRLRIALTVVGLPGSRVAVDLPVKDLPVGVYFIRASDRSGKAIGTQKVVIMR